MKPLSGLGRLAVVESRDVVGNQVFTVFESLDEAIRAAKLWKKNGIRCTVWEL